MDTREVITPRGERGQVLGSLATNWNVLVVRTEGGLFLFAPEDLKPAPAQPAELGRR